MYGCSLCFTSLGKQILNACSFIQTGTADSRINQGTLKNIFVYNFHKLLFNVRVKSIFLTFLMMQFITRSIGILAITTLPVMNEIVLEIQNKLIPDLFIPYKDPTVC